MLSGLSDVGVFCLTCRCLHFQLGTKSFIRLCLTLGTFCSTLKKGNRFGFFPLTLLILMFFSVAPFPSNFVRNYTVLAFTLMFTSGVRSVCEDASRRGEEGEEEQADAGQR